MWFNNNSLDNSANIHNIAIELIDLQLNALSGKENGQQSICYASTLQAMKAFLNLKYEE